jgi:hypothetical protein
METSIFLAQAFGIYLVIMSLFLILEYKTLRPLVDEFASSPALILLSGFISLILGILLILSHNVWVMGWPVVITILSWLVFIQGIARLFFTHKLIPFIRFSNNRRFYLIVGIVTLLIGLFLLYHGFKF